MSVVSPILLRSPLARDTQMTVITEKIPNVIGNENQMRFEIPRKAILDGGSKILLSMNVGVNDYTLTTANNVLILSVYDTGSATSQTFQKIEIPIGTYTKATLVTALNLVGNRSWMGNTPPGGASDTDVVFELTGGDIKVKETNATGSIIWRLVNESVPEKSTLLNFSAVDVPAWTTPNTGGIALSGLIQPLKMTSSEKDSWYLPFQTGVMSLIQRATLTTSSGRTIADSTFFNQKSVSEQLFKDGYKRKNHDSYRYGMNGFYEYELFSDADQALNTIKLGNGTSSVDSLSIKPNDITRLKSTDVTTPTFQVPLDSLFAYMYENQLPTGFLNESMFIDLYFADNVLGERCVNLTNPTSASPSTTLNTKSCFLYADFLVYDEERQGQVREIMAEQGLQQTYDDYLTQVINIPNLPDATAEKLDSRFIGGANHSIKSICCSQTALNDTGGKKLNSVLGDFYSDGTRAKTSWNYRINNVNLFMDNDRTWSENYSHTQQYYGISPFVPRQMYCVDSPMATAQQLLSPNVKITSDLVNPPSASPTMSDLAGQMGIFCLNLQDMRGAYTQVEDTPIHMELVRKEPVASDKVGVKNGLNQYYFITYRRGFVIDGAGNIFVDDRTM